MPVDASTLEFIGRQQETILTELAFIREELKSERLHVRDLHLSLMLISDGLSRHDRHLSEIRDDVASSINLEVSGSIAIFKSRVEQSLTAQSGEIKRIFQEAVLDITAADKPLKVPTLPNIS